MTMRIGGVLSKKINKKELDIIRKDTELALIETNNSYINRQLNSDEEFFQATYHGIDHMSGIGAYDIYTKDLTPVYEATTEKNKYLLDGILEIREGYYTDASKWVNIIKKIKNKYKVQKFGIIYFNGDTTSDEIKLDISKRTVIKIKELSIECLMKMKEDTLTFFE